MNRAASSQCEQLWRDQASEEPLERAMTILHQQATPGSKRRRIMAATQQAAESADCSCTSRPTRQILSLTEPHLQSAHPPPVLDCLLERALTDADSALALTTNAMHMASTVCLKGGSHAADAALALAEQALAATMHQLAVAQALVSRKAQHQQAVLVWQAQQQRAAEDEDLQDTGSSSHVAAA